MCIFPSPRFPPTVLSSLLLLNLSFSSAMTSFNGLGQVLESKLPENQTLVESLSSPWSHNKPKQPVELSSFTELFGELHFKESLESSALPFLPPFPVPSASSSLLDLYPKPDIAHTTGKNLSFGALLNPKENQENSSVKKKDTFSSMNLESLHMCTEGLGFESSEDVDGSDNGKANDWENQKPKVDILKHSSSEIPYTEYRRLRRFPPPIPSIGRNGKPWVSYKSFRRDGRLVLKEVMNHGHGQEFMHACREDGRLTLHLVHRDEETHQDKEEVKQEG